MESSQHIFVPAGQCADTALRRWLLFTFALCAENSTEGARVCEFSIFSILIKKKKNWRALLVLLLLHEYISHGEEKSHKSSGP